MIAPIADGTMLRIGLVEDDAMLRERILLPGLGRFGFAAIGMETAASLQAQLGLRTFDIIVIDVGLPDADGFAVAREVREAFPEMGIVMLTGRGGTPDRVLGLSQGADAYLAKPVEMELLAATLHSLARRLGGGCASLSSKRWHLDASGWCLVSPAGGTVALTRTERRVMERLAVAPGNLVERDDLISTLTDNVHDFDTHRLDSLIYRLRRKVADACGESLPLNAVHGVGYVFNSQP